MTTNSADTADTAIAKEAVEANGAQSQRTNPPTLRLDNVSYAYAKGGKRVLKNISHDFQAGKVHAITGPSGAGKTCICRRNTRTNVSCTCPAANSSVWRSPAR